MHQTVTDPDLNETDDAILQALAEGRNVPTNLGDYADRSRQYVHQRLKLLETADYIQNVGNGVYELQPGEIPQDVRDRLEIEHSDESDLLARLQDALEARDDAQARADRLESELDDCKSLLDDARDESVDIDKGRILSGLETAATALEGQNPDIDMARSEIERALEGLE